jgi:signal transduction histidine kinase/CheY-like chemotaxis protein
MTVNSGYFFLGKMSTLTALTIRVALSLLKFPVPVGVVPRLPDGITRSRKILDSRTVHGVASEPTVASTSKSDFDPDIEQLLTKIGNISWEIPSVADTSVTNSKYSRVLDAIEVLGLDYSKMRQERDSARAKLIQTAKMATVGELTATVIHEINNPLAIIKAYLELLTVGIEAGNLPAEKVQAYIDRANSGVAKLSHLLKGFRSFNRIDSANIEEIDLNSVLQDISDFTDVIFQKNAIRITRSLSSERFMINGNTGWIHQIVVNLMNNARDACDGKAGEISLASFSAGRKIGFTISDNGKGIPPENLNLIFDNFFTTKEKEDGTGIGLSVVKQLVTSMGGNISVTSTVGKGTKFTIEFSSASSQPTFSKELAKAASSKQPELSERKILICEDDSVTRNMLCSLFVEFGFEVHTAEDGRIGLNLMVSSRYTHVLTDLKMPVMDGDEMIVQAAARNIDVGSIIFMSGQVQSEAERSRLRGLHSNVVLVLIKPVSIDVFEKFFGLNTSLLDKSQKAS